MPTHAERRILPHRPEELFDLVADIERYPEFLPWCVGARITRRQGNVIWGDLMVGFKVFRETFTSKVTLAPPRRIDVEYVNGPFRYLNNHWIFEPEHGGLHTTLSFYIDFEFKTRLFQKVAQAAFNEAVKRMVQAFENRARAVYGVNELPAEARGTEPATTKTI